MWTMPDYPVNRWFRGNQVRLLFYRNMITLEAHDP